MPQPKILITGAASGIGRAVAELFAAKGFDLVLVDLADLSDVARQHSATQRLQGDVSDEDFWSAIEAKLAGLTHAVVNAGVSSGGPIDALEFAEWRRVMSVNLDGAFLTLRAALREIKASTGPRAIVITGSVSGMKAEPGVAAYGASKAAVLQLAKVAAKEAAPGGIRVNAIAPGGVDTNMTNKVDFPDDMDWKLLRKNMAPENQMLAPSQPAGLIAFLASDEADGITGTVVPIDWGITC